MLTPRFALLIGATLVSAAGCGGSSLSNGQSCQQLMDAYDNAYPAAQACTPGAAAQCQQQPPGIGGCNCGSPVEDATELNAIAAQLRAKGCIPAQTVECPCAYHGQPTCLVGDGGAGLCGYSPNFP